MDAISEDTSSFDGFRGFCGAETVVSGATTGDGTGAVAVSPSNANDCCRDVDNVGDESDPGCKRGDDNAKLSTPTLRIPDPCEAGFDERSGVGATGVPTL